MPDRTYYYLAGLGPMTGYPQFNFPAFDEAAARLRGRGFNIVSPTELDDKSTRYKSLASPNGIAAIGDSRWRELLRRDVNIVMDEECKGVICLPGWENSIGALLETYVAEAFGKTIYRYGDDPEYYILHLIDRNQELEKAGAA